MIWVNELVTLAISNGLEKIGFYVLGIVVVDYLEEEGFIR